MTRKEMLDFLKKLNVKAELVGENNHYKRNIVFQIYGMKYTITWYINESTLQIGDGARAPLMPFRYMYHDTTYPLVGRNESIGFSYTKLNDINMIDRKYPYEVLRIPLEL